MAVSDSCKMLAWQNSQRDAGGRTMVSWGWQARASGSKERFVRKEPARRKGGS